MNAYKIYPPELMEIADELHRCLGAACTMVPDHKERERIFAAIVIDILEFQDECPPGTHFVTAGTIFSAGVGGLSDDPMQDHYTSTMIKAATAWYLMSGQVKSV